MTEYVVLSHFSQFFFFTHDQLMSLITRNREKSKKETKLLWTFQINVIWNTQMFTMCLQVL